ncbi:MAG: MATE family efflux transporter, partial [Tissierellia bacterium]|nr:MATE family efflux transporter [Tissierellia bacterium]
MNNLREQQLREKPIKALFWQFSIPAITGMIVQALYNIVDRIFIGHMPQDSAL